MTQAINDRDVNSPRGLRRALVLYGLLFPAAVARYVPLPLRLIVGYGFAQHGCAKLWRGSGDFAGLLHALGTPYPHFFAWTTIVTEIAGGACILLGAFVPPVSIPMAVVLLVAIFTVHLQYGFSSIKLREITPAGAHFGEPGYETDLLYLACIAALVIGGSGPLSIDGWMSRYAHRQPDPARRAV